MSHLFQKLRIVHPQAQNSGQQRQEWGFSECGRNRQDQVLSCCMHKSAILLNYITEDLQSRFKETTHTISTTNQSSLVGMCASVCFPSCMSVGLLSICRFNHISLVWEDCEDWSCLMLVHSLARAKKSGEILTKCELVALVTNVNSMQTYKLFCFWLLTRKRKITRKTIRMRVNDLSYVHDK